MEPKNSLSLLPSQGDFQLLQILAKNASISGLYAGVGSEQKILMVLLAAQELGIKPMQALNGGIWNIQGKIEISARLMNSMIRRAGHSITVKQCDSKACIMEGKRSDNGDTFTASFTMEDAQKAGLASRDVWKKYTEDMLYNRAMSRLARRLFPDVIGTAYVEGEIREAEFEILDSNQSQEETKSSEPSQEEIDLVINEFINRFPEENAEMIVKYLVKYSNHWKKSMIESINDYQDHDRFLSDLGKFKKKEEPKS